MAINSSFKSVRDYDSDAADIYPVFYEIFAAWICVTSQHYL